MSEAHEHDYDLKKLKKISVRGLTYFVAPRYTYHYLDNEYEDLSLDLFLSYIKGGETVLDLGAHYGIFSLLAARKGAKVQAFEPVPANYQVLNKNVEANGLKVVTHQKAVSDSTGTRTFNIPWASDSAGFFEHPHAETIQKIKVETTSLDEALGAIRVNLMKIDTEGNEISVLEGARKLIAHNKDHLKMFIEFNPEVLRRAGKKPEDLLKIIDDLGFRQYFIHDQERKLQLVRDFDHWESYLGGKDYINIFCLPKSISLDIAVISHTAELGGAELVMISLLDSLKDLGVVPHVLLPEHGALEERLKNSAITYEIIPYRSWARNMAADSAQMNKEDIYNTQAIRMIYNSLIESRPEVVLTNTIVIPWAAVAARAIGIPNVWLIHEFGDKDHGFTFDYPYIEILHTIDRLSDLVITNSKSVHNYVKRGIDSEKVKQIYHSVKIPEGIEQKDKKDTFRISQSFRLALVGRIMPSKGQMDAIRAVKILKDYGYKVELVLVGAKGDKDYVKKIEDFVEQNELKELIHFVDFTNNPYTYVMQSNAVLMCSRNEAFGRVTVEGMLLGKPVIGSNSGGTPEIIKNQETGLLYKPGDPEDLAQKISTLIKNPNKALGMGQKAMEVAKEKFSENGSTLTIYKWLKEVVDQRHEVQPTYLYEKLIKGFSDTYNKLQNLTEQNKEQAESINKYMQHNQALEVQLREIKSSRAWKLARAMQKTSSKIPRKFKG
jgi:FkbM family methyltransferase